MQIVDIKYSGCIIKTIKKANLKVSPEDEGTLRLCCPDK